MKKVVSMMMAVMLLLNVSFGYTLTVTYNGSQTVREVAGGESVIVGLSSRDDANYTVDTGNAILEVHGNRRQFVMPEGNVGITITDIEEGVQEKTVLDMRVGDYVTYYPTETECDLTALTGVEQEPLNPSKTIQWRVLSNDGENVELVSAESVGDLWLGWNANDDFENAIPMFPYGNRDIAKIHYANIVKILNDISESYVNSSVATEGRGLGWNGSSAEEINTSDYPITYASASENASIVNGQVFFAGEPYSDIQYLQTNEIVDYNAMANNGMLNNGESVWLASRHCWGYSTNVGCGVSILNDEGSVEQEHFLSVYEDASFSSSIVTYGIRPVIKLQEGIMMRGKGTEEEPYTLIEESKSIVVFENNGGKETYFKPVVNGSPYGELPKVTKDNYVLEGWYLDEALTQKVTKETIVTITENHTLYAKWEEPYFADKAKVGDYVIYNPPTENTCNLTDITGITQDALIPSDTSAWRVLSVDEESGIVEIISADSVGDLTLDGTDNYVRLIKILNDISKTYVDETVATSGRGLDWNGISVEVFDTQEYPLTYEAIYGNGLGCREPYTDMRLTSHSDGNLCGNDVKVLAANNMLYSGGSVWRASRHAGFENSTVRFCYVPMTSEGFTNNSYYMGYVTVDNEVRFYSFTAGVRPIVILKSEINATGAGTEGNPWVIEAASNGAEGVYTVEYNANGGTGTTASSVHTIGVSSQLTSNGFSRDGWTFAGWNTAVDGSGTSYANEASVLNLTETANGTVTLYAQWRVCCFEEMAQVGDYVIYTPPVDNVCNLSTITGLSQNSLVPSNTTQWRVLSNDGTTIELVSADSVGTLTLGVNAKTTDGGASFEWGSAADLELSKTQYVNAVEILNEISDTYADGEIAIEGRALGWNGITENPIEVDNISWTFINNLERGDYLYDEVGDDIFSEWNIGGTPWLAERWSRILVEVGYFLINRMHLLTIEELAEESFSNTADVCPVIVLNTGLNPTGDGSIEQPWKLN